MNAYTREADGAYSEEPKSLVSRWLRAATVFNNRINRKVAERRIYRRCTGLMNDALDEAYLLVADWTHPDYLSDDNMDRASYLIEVSGLLLDAARDFNEKSSYKSVLVDDYKDKLSDISARLEDNKKDTAEKRRIAEKARIRCMDALEKTQTALQI